MIGGMREDLPGGTVTFLFTDVEGSTDLLHELGAERYADALTAHRHVIRAAVHEHGGVEVDTQGDAFFVAFPTAPGALAAAAQSVAKLARGPIRVRIGLQGYLFEGRRWLDGALVATRGTRSAARAKALGGAALLSTMQGDRPAARLWATEARSLGLELGEARDACVGMLTLGRAALAEGHPEEGIALFEEASELGAATGNREAVALAGFNLGYAALERGDPGRARTAFERVVEETHVGVALVRLDPARSARLLAQAAARREELGGSLTGIELRLHDDALEALRAALAPDDLARAWASGRTAALADVLDEIEGCTSS